MAEQRKNQTDKGAVALATDILVKIFGLSQKTSEEIFRKVRTAGELQTMKNHMIDLDSSQYKRLNQILDVLSNNTTTDSDDTTQEKNQESLKERFDAYMQLDEVQFSTQDLEDPETKRQIMRYARASGSQQDIMKQRMERERRRDRQEDIRKEENPQKAAIKRRIAGLERQIEMQRKRLKEID